MSGIGEMAYTLLLGWMRTIVDWGWSLASGRGGSSFWQWFLSNWKVWLVILVLGGLVADWVMWMVRWRPYRLLFGRVQRASREPVEEAWDEGVGFYGLETAADADPLEWTDETLHTLSEIDPDWAGGVVMESAPLASQDFPEDAFYNEAYEEPPTAYMEDTQDGYFAETPDEQEQPADVESSDQPDWGYYAETEDEQSFDGEEDSYIEEADFPEEPEPSTEEEIEVAPQEDAAENYGRPGLWPGSFPFAGYDGEPRAMEERAHEPLPDSLPEDATQTYEAEEPSPRRRRRSLRASDADSWRPEDPLRYTEQPEPMEAQPSEHFDPRPSLLVEPKREAPSYPEKGKKGILRTVTGKPADRRGFMRFTASQDEPIAGLLPLELDDAFLPPAMPDDVDFAPDEGEEFDATKR